MDLKMKQRKVRMLESLAYIDDDLISGTLRKIKPDVHTVVATDINKNPFKHWKRIAVMVACLVLLSCAIPLISYLMPRIGITIGGNAGAGNEEFLNYDPYTDSAVFVYPVDMPAEEIYADVCEGGWLVSAITDFNSANKKTVTGEGLWEDFYRKVVNKEPAVFRSAFYVEKNNISTYLPEGVYEPDGKPVISLSEVVYDGEKFYYSYREMFPSYSYDSSEVKEYIYLRLSLKNNEKDQQFYFLTNDPDLRWWSPFLSLPAPDYKEIYRPED